MLEKFNVRVYGLVIQNQCVLVSKEQYGEYNLVKFPGGGVELGEGILNALKREFIEELGTEIIEQELFHITEQFIQSAFRQEEQVIAIYYLVKVKHTNFIHSEHEVSWEEINLNQLEKIGFSFEQDKQVYQMLCNQNK